MCRRVRWSIEVTIADGDAHRRARFRRRVAVQGRRAVGRGAGGLFTREHAVQPRRIRTGAEQHGARGSRRASPTSSRTRTSPAASRRCCVCSTPTATPRSSPIRISRRSTTRRRRSRPATGSRSTSRASSAAASTSTNVVTTTSQYIDTGVLLQVTPHINAGGLITLDVQAEVSDPGHRRQSRRCAADQHALGADDRQRADPDRRW